MLVLTRRIGEEVVIAGDIRVRVVAIYGHKVRLGITAPPSITVDREEVHARRCAKDPVAAGALREPAAQEDDSEQTTADVFTVPDGASS